MVARGSTTSARIKISHRSNAVGCSRVFLHGCFLVSHLAVLFRWLSDGTAGINPLLRKARPLRAPGYPRCIFLAPIFL